MTNSVRVLHVDDDLDFLQMATELLRRRDEQLVIETATNAKEGLDKLAHEEFDCIISDYDMPEQDGIEFLESVRERHPDLPFILFTGKGSEEIASEAICKGVTDYVRKKPDSKHFDIVANRVLNGVERYRARRAAEDNEQRLREMAECSRDILWMFSADWSELLFINSAYEELWGRSADALREDADDFLNGIHPEDRPAVEEAMEQLSDGESVEIDYRVNEDEEFGRRVWVQGEPIFDDDGKVMRIGGYARDVTETMRYQLDAAR